MSGSARTTFAPRTGSRLDVAAGTEFAVGISDGSIFMWPQTSAASSELSYSSPVTSLAFTPDGGRLVAGHADGSVRWWIRV